MKELIISSPSQKITRLDRHIMHWEVVEVGNEIRIPINNQTMGELVGISIVDELEPLFAVIILEQIIRVIVASGNMVQITELPYQKEHHLSLTNFPQFDMFIDENDE